jgi:hypothetical protein
VDESGQNEPAGQSTDAVEPTAQLTDWPCAGATLPISGLPYNVSVFKTKRLKVVPVSFLKAIPIYL